MTTTPPIHHAIILGTGFAGLGMAIALRRAGLNDFVVLEKGDDVGGTWRDNHYPGCACDIPSHLYSFSFAPNPKWSRMYAPQTEILDYLRDCARRFDILPHVRLREHVLSASFDEAEGLWKVRSADAGAMQRYLEQRGKKPGDAIDLHDEALPPTRVRTAQIVISGMGGLSTPSYPSIPGLETFHGKRFHSQTWDHRYDLRGKRVAVVGTGASAIQFVPQIASKVAQLHLYQRSPPWILPKPDRAMASLERAMFARAPFIQNLYRAKIFLQHEVRALAFRGNAPILKLAQRQALAHLRRQVRDPHLLRKLEPQYRLGCKRVLISDDYYPSLTRTNVEVVTDGIAEARGSSIVSTTGVQREVDAIILATGFRPTAPVAPGMFAGVGGVDLAERWSRGPEAYKGTTVTGFPNLFFIVGPNCGLAHSSMVLMIESQIRYIMDALATMRARGLARLEVTPEAQARYNRDLQTQLERRIWSAAGCQSWYLHESGKNVTLWPGFTWQFRRITARFDPDHYRTTPS